MIVINRLHPIFRRFMAPESGGEGSGGGAVDRGDDWTPTDGDAAAEAAALEKAEADKKAAEEAAAKEKAKEPKTKEEGEGEEGEESEKKGKKDTRIPLSRHQEILAKERERREALERELAASRKGEEVAKTNDEIAKAEQSVVAMEAEYLKLLEEGKTKEAAAKMSEIRRAERGIVETRAKFETEAAEARAYERVKYDNTVERLEAAFPVINPDHADFDKEKVAEVIELRDAYVATGKHTRAEALQKACKVLLKPATTKQETATEVDVRVDKDDVAKAAAAERKKAAVEKNLDAAKKQPPNTANVGSDSDKTGGALKATDVIKMKQDDFKKLDDAALSKLRGDDL